MNKRKIVFLTGTRADFGKLKPLINIVESSKDFDCYIFVTGMHTLSKYGATFTEIKKLGYKHIFIYMNQTNTTEPDIILSNTVTGFSNFTLIMVLSFLNFIIHYHVDYVKMHYGIKNSATTRYWREFGLDQLAHQLTYLGFVYLILR